MKKNWTAKRDCEVGWIVEYKDEFVYLRKRWKGKENAMTEEEAVAVANELNSQKILASLT